jgi:hypothetical protein
MKTTISTAILLCVLIFTSCKKNKTDTPAQEKNVYILTNEQGSNNNGIVKVFKNGTLVSTIGDGSAINYFGQDLEVSGSDIYILAYKFVPSTSTQSTVIYKNGVEIQTIPNTSGFNPNCLAISGNDIYACGTEFTPSGGIGAPVKLWKNGVVTAITNGMNSDTRAWDMVVNGTDVYIAGYIDMTNGRKACYWKNGTLVYFDASTTINNSQAHRIVVNGTDIYASGFADSKATYWKNTTATQLSTANSYSYGIAVNGTDVFTAAGIAQSNNNYRAASIKNGTVTQLSNASNYSSSAFGIGVKDNDVYVIGGVNVTNGSSMQAVYWKNGTENVLVNNVYAEAYRLVIK